MNDSFLWYNVGNWAQHGLAVPNWGNDHSSQNSVIRDLVSTMGRKLQEIMWHTDSRMADPPSINTIIRVHQLCTAARVTLQSRAVAPGTPFLEPKHTLPAPEVFIIHPAPYFKVRNQWLKEYATYALLAMGEAFQHTDNARALEISEDFARLIGQYVQRIYRNMAMDLLRVPLEEASKPDFTLSNEQLASYNPREWHTGVTDPVPDLQNWPTEDQLAVLTAGIPVTQVPNLGPYPSTPTAVAGGSTTVNTSSGSFIQ